MKQSKKTNQQVRRRKLGVTQFNVEVPNDLARGLKAIAALEGRPVRQIALELLQAFYEERRKTARMP